MADGETHHSHWRSRTDTESSFPHTSLQNSIHLWPSSFAPPTPHPRFFPAMCCRSPLSKDRTALLLTFHCISFTDATVRQKIYLQRQTNRAQSSSWNCLSHTHTHIHSPSKIRSNVMSWLSDSVAGLSRPAKNSSTQSLLRMPFSVIERDSATASSSQELVCTDMTQHLPHLHQPSPALSSFFSAPFLFLEIHFPFSHCTSLLLFILNPSFYSYCGDLFTQCCLEEAVTPIMMSCSISYTSLKMWLRI